MHDDEIAHYGPNKGPRTDHVEDSKAVEDAKGEQSHLDVWDAWEGQVWVSAVEEEMQICSSTVAVYVSFWRCGSIVYRGVENQRDLVNSCLFIRIINIISIRRKPCIGWSKET